MSQVKLMNDILIELNQAKNSIDEIECILRDCGLPVSIKSQTMDSNARNLVRLGHVLKDLAYRLGDDKQMNLKGVL